MKHFRIKICGITRLEDALMADQLGADMIGFIFYKKSPRYIAPPKARRIAEKLAPTIDKVGVFVDPTTKQILTLSKQFGLDYVQLHGKFPPTLIRELHRNNMKVIQSFHVQNLNSYREVFKSKADIIQLDNSEQNKFGGTGKQFNWLLKPPKKMSNLMLSGGLNIKNLKTGLARFQPLIVDINSGVESQPGIKSAVKLKQFFKFANNLRYGTKA